MKLAGKSVVVTGGGNGIGEQGIGAGCDVSDPDAIGRLVSAAEDSFGPNDS